MEKVVKKLFELGDSDYRNFISGLVPVIPIERIIGVRAPALKNFAKELLLSNDHNIFLKELPHYYLEENGLHAILIPMISKEIDIVLGHIETFLPYIDNWATCDSLNPKIFGKYPDKVFPRILEWIGSNRTYTVRFGIVSLLQFYLDKNFKAEINNIVASISSDEYYIKMAIAWYYSYALVKQYEVTLPFFESGELERWIHNKSIQKALESYRISDDRKDHLRTLRRKKD